MAEFAIIRTGGKQYKVKAGDILKVEKLKSSKDGKFEFADILFNKKVSAKILQDMKNPKVVILKHHSKKRYHKTQGHRQIMTEIKIEDIK